MDHNYLLTEPTVEVEVLLLNHPDYNLDKSDSISDIPEYSGVFAVCGRVNGKPANCRVVRASNNVQEAVRQLYMEVEEDDCVREYMRSIKTKLLIYKIVPDAEPVDLEQLATEWEAEYNPQCNEELNKVY